MELNPILKKVKRIAVEAGKYQKSHLGKIQSTEFKGDPRNVVTDVDKYCEQFITEELLQILPEAGVFGEEFGEKGKNKPYRWLIDPLDGTTNFYHAFPHFAVSIALEFKEDLLLGVVFDPMLQEIFSACAEQGAQLNGKPIKVSNQATMDQSLIATGFSYSPEIDRAKQIDQAASILEVAQDIRRTGSAALDLCYVACGRLEGYYESMLAPWDTAAGSLIVREAGGLVTTYSGQMHTPFHKQVIATNGLVHRPLLQIVKE